MKEKRSMRKRLKKNGKNKETQMSQNKNVQDKDKNK